MYVEASLMSRLYALALLLLSECDADCLHLLIFAWWCLWHVVRDSTLG